MLDIDFVCCCVSERRAASQQFIIDNGKTPAEHVFDLNDSVIQGHGQCALHGRRCKLGDSSPHCSTNGPPCQPFTWQRDHTGVTAKTGDVESHPDYDTVMLEWEQYLKRRTPHSWFLEEVGAFMSKAPSGETYLRIFLRKCTRLGYAVRVFELKHEVWVSFIRARTVVYVGTSTSSSSGTRGSSSSSSSSSSGTTSSTTTAATVLLPRSRPRHISQFA